MSSDDLRMIKQPNSHYCFICGLKNVGGVQVTFYETEDDVGHPEILARFTGQEIHQGYPQRMHGGVIMGILDETIGRVVNIGDAAEPAVWGVTGDFSMRFRRPVPLDVELTARGRMVEDKGRTFDGTGELYLPDGTVAVRAQGTYFKLTLDDIADVDPEALGWRVYED